MKNQGGLQEKSDFSSRKKKLSKPSMRALDNRELKYQRDKVSDRNATCTVCMYVHSFKTLGNNCINLY